MVAELATPPEIPELDRFSLYAQLGMVSVMEPATEVLMQERADALVRRQDYGPHERPWHVSFHASAFPGDPVDACERHLIYRMIDAPPDKAMPPWVTVTGVVGKAGELDLADAWFRGGRLLAIPEDFELESDAQVHQLGFVDRSVWLTCSTDLPILPKGWRKPYIVEAKGKADEVLQEMLTGIRKDGTRAPAPRGPDKAHVRQVKATIGLAHEYDWGRVMVCKDCWFVLWSELYERLGIPGGQHPLSDAFGICPRCQGYGGALEFDLEPPTSGEIYYWSRSWPRTTKSFYFEYDKNFVDAGREVLARARRAFLGGALPARPEHFQWSVGPCGACQFKPSCRLDHGLEGPRKRKPTLPPVVKLAESNAVAYAESMRPDYDYASVRARVLSEWS